MWRGRHDDCQVQMVRSEGLDQEFGGTGQNDQLDTGKLALVLRQRTRQAIRERRGSNA